LADDAPRALCVDLDGTLVATDTAYETIARLARRKPWLLPMPRSGGCGGWRR